MITLYLKTALELIIARLNAQAANIFLINDKKKLYLARHSPSKTKENWSVPDTPASASRWILWNLPTVKASFNDYVKRFKLKIKK